MVQFSFGGGGPGLHMGGDGPGMHFGGPGMHFGRHHRGPGGHHGQSNPCCGVGFGLLLLLASLAGLWYNEGNSVQTYTAPKEVEGLVREDVQVKGADLLALDRQLVSAQCSPRTSKSKSLRARTPPTDALPSLAFSSPQVHFTGRTEGSELRDDEFGVAVKGLALRRRPEIFQWVEHRHEHNSDDDHHSHKRVTYSYS